MHLYINYVSAKLSEIIDGVNLCTKNFYALFAIQLLLMHTFWQVYAGLVQCLVMIIVFLEIGLPSMMVSAELIIYQLLGNAL